MIVTFEEDYLRDLYETGKMTDKKYRFQPEIVKKYRRCVDTLIKKNIMITLKGVDPRMIANNLTPFEPTHPGEVLKEEIEYREIPLRKLAMQMNVEYSELNQILNSKRQVNTEYALLFEAALGIEAEMLIKMQTRYNMQMARKDRTFSERLLKIRNAAATILVS